jgi:hypothetical protein
MGARCFAAAGSCITVKVEVAALAGNTCDVIMLGHAQTMDPSAVIEAPFLKLSIDAKADRRGRTVRSKDHLLDNTHRRQVLADPLRISHRKPVSLGVSSLLPKTHQPMKAYGILGGEDRIVIWLLSPDIQIALLLSSAPDTLDPDKIIARQMPLDWAEQRRLFGLAAGGPVLRFSRQS